jgi:hypothetical protein
LKINTLGLLSWWLKQKTCFEAVFVPWLVSQPTTQILNYVVKKRIILFDFALHPANRGIFTAKSAGKGIHGQSGIDLRFG